MVLKLPQIYWQQNLCQKIKGLELDIDSAESSSSRQFILDRTFCPECDVMDRIYKC